MKLRQTLISSSRSSHSSPHRSASVQAYTVSLLAISTAPLGFPQILHHSSRMDPVHDGHGGEHQQSVEEVDEYLVPLGLTTLALRISHHTHHGSQQSENADSVQTRQLLLPGYRLASRRRSLLELNLENCRRCDEKAERN